MLNWMMVPLIAQLTAVPEEFYQPEVSDEVRVIVNDIDGTATEEQVNAILSLSEVGDDSATQLLGEMYLLGALGAQPNAELGCSFFEQLGSRRPLGLHNLATCYQFGNGREKDLAKARDLFRRAAEGGSRMSYCAYGNMLIAGEGGPKDETEGLRLCRMTAVAGDRDAQTDYGGYLLMGVGGERDPVTARFILEEAAAQEQRNAAFLLGQIYQKGDGVETDYAQSGEWFEKAYRWGRKDAAMQAAMQLVRRGYSQNGDSISVTPELLRQAIDWLEVAAAEDPNPAQREDAASLISNLEVLIARASEAER